MKIVVKLGGSLITDKGKAYAVKEDVILSAAEAIKNSLYSGSKIIIVHGGGSFGHVAAKKEIERHGKLVAESIPPVSRAMMELNYHIMDALSRKGVNAASFPPHSFCLYSCNSDSFSCYFEPVLRAFYSGIVPVTFGDIVLGIEGCDPAIVSGDDLALILAEKIGAERVVFATNVDGVYEDLEKPNSLMTYINLLEIPKLLEQIKISSGGVTDVTKGLPGKLMKMHKYLVHLKRRPEVAIINGMKKEILESALSGLEVKGTLIA